MNGCPFLEYRAAESAFKPYVAQLYTPRGVPVLQDSPPDHIHHHGLMFAVGVNDENFWQETPGPPGSAFIGRQRGGALQAQTDPNNQAPSTVRVSQDVDWLGREDRPLVRERRELVANCQPQQKQLLLTWTSQLSPAEGQDSVTLNGERYFGLGMRFASSLPAGGQLLFADDRSDTPVDGKENLIQASWCAYLPKGQGKDLTVAMFGSPKNPRHPTRWFTMVDPFSYLSATINLQDHPLVLRSNEKLELRYGIAVADGTLTHENLQRLYQAWQREPVAAAATPPK